jgi:MFS transporter, YNFM family, putative membrane transport protein
MNRVPPSDDRSPTALAGFLLGASGMFAVIYSTQAILPRLSADFDVSAATSGLTVSAVVLCLAAGAWLWGPLSDRWGRRRTLICASALVVPPTVLAGLAPSFGVLLACRALQGLILPGLLTVGPLYVMEVFGPRLGGRAMGYYLTALVAGGLLGRVGVALSAAVVGWRVPLVALAALPAASAVVMWRTLPDAPAQARSGRGGHALLALLRNRQVLTATGTGAGAFLAFVGVFSYVTFRLEAPPFDWTDTASGLVFVLWVLGGLGPVAGRFTDRFGWRAVALAMLSCVAVGVLLSLADSLVTLIPALALITAGMFCGVTAAQIGIATASESDRGTATAIYFSAYYAAGALGGYLPGLAWEAWSWPGVVGVALAGLLPALALLSAQRAPVAARAARV